MNKKSFADLCLERAAAATPGPWENRCKEFSNTEIPRNIWSEYGYIAVTNGPFNSAIADAEFIAQARQMVPELAKRLTDAIQIARELLPYGLEKHHKYYEEELLKLESMPEDET